MRIRPARTINPAGVLIRSHAPRSGPGSPRRGWRVEPEPPAQEVVPLLEGPSVEHIEPRLDGVLVEEVDPVGEHGVRDRLRGAEVVRVRGLTPELGLEPPHDMHSRLDV